MDTEGQDRTASAALTRWQKVRLVIKVVELRLRFIALMTITGLVFGYWDTIWNYYEKWTRPPGERLTAVSDIEYFCPMHPSVVRDAPGTCPLCGMPLSQRTRGEKETLPEGVVSRVSLSPSRVQQAGVQAVEVGYTPLLERLTTVGQVVYDERRLARIASKTKGMARVEALHVNFTGTAVKPGEPLAELYSPELYQAVRELLLAQKSAAERSRKLSGGGRSLLGDGTDLVALAPEKLGLWGITPEQIDAILAKGTAESRVTIVSPIGGVVVRKNVVQGQYVAEGEAMFEVADLSRVWVQAQVYEDQVGRLKLGQLVAATVESFPGEVFRGTVSFIDPVLNAPTRTLGVRYDLENPDGRLRPGMYATVTLETPVSEAPAFRDRIARRRSTDRAVLHAARSADEQKVCLVSGATLGSMGIPLSVDVRGEKVWLCCADCEPKLKRQPTRYLPDRNPPPEDAVLTVPESAVIDTGLRKVVYVEAEPGVFEGREVVLGPRSGDVYPVLDGLAAGERVAAAGAFLIDAESRLNPGTAMPPVMGDGPVRSASTSEGAHAH
jgi:Cu(I)/Ag(I) efflux system membrane fusion protein